MRVKTEVPLVVSHPLYVLLQWARDLFVIGILVWTPCVAERN